MDRGTRLLPMGRVVLIDAYTGARTIALVVAVVVFVGTFLISVRRVLR